MYDHRMYPDRYSRYAGSNNESSSGRVILTYLEIATSTEQPCRFNPKGGSWRSQSEGQTFDYDADLRIPEDSTLLPDSKGDVPDKVVITRFSGATVSRTFRVISVYSSFGLHKRAFLKEI